ncbi:MAG: type I pullulanase [Bacillota bacterium]|nr:type I pullulanase [Bacillota bacterium]
MDETRKFFCYLDEFDELTIIVPLKNYRDNNTYQLVGEEETVDLIVVEKINLGVEVKLVCSFDAYIALNQIYHIVDHDGITSELYTGKIVRTDLFDNIYAYKKNDLGFTYTPESTKFKIWTPVAKRVTLELVFPDGKMTFLDVPYRNQGVWRLVVEGDLDRCRYRYRVYVNGMEKIVNDPYAVASDANGNYNFVVDKNKFVKMEHDFKFSGDPLEAIVYEMSVRDYTIDPAIHAKYPGKFLGLAETGLKTPAGNPAGLDYLATTGITHVQLMPIFDFDGIDENRPDDDYNWGYNPQQYNVPEGWFSTDPNDPYARIDELKTAIDALHAKNIGVIMDVVYNHVFDQYGFPFEILVPGYAYHVDRQGIHTNVSGCKNDLATHRKMVRKLIIDSALYWATEYKIDGFRFDLMGLIDVETMNELRQELHELDDRILVYGEGWKMYSSNMADRMAHMMNKNVIYTIGFFNDRFRETIKGKTFDPKVPGFATGDPTDFKTVKEMLLGSAANRFMFKYASQSVNYVECHDNLTYFDKCLSITGDVEKIKRWEMLATAMVLFAQGMPFIHSGQEFFRTKNEDENSFESGDGVNHIDWSRLDQFSAAVTFFRACVAIRRNHACFRLKASSELLQNAEVIALKSQSILYSLNDGANLLIVFKPLSDPETVVIPGSYRLILASEPVDRDASEGGYGLKRVGTYVFQKRDEPHEL